MPESAFLLRSACNTVKKNLDETNYAPFALIFSHSGQWKSQTFAFSSSFHDYYKKYKNFFPKWDIQPSAETDHNKFWCWVMAKFKDDLVRRYCASGVDLPASWQDISKEAAIASLK